jgi:hypothetical protein
MKTTQLTVISMHLPAVSGVTEATPKLRHLRGPQTSPGCDRIGAKIAGRFTPATRN